MDRKTARRLKAEDAAYENPDVVARPRPNWRLMKFTHPSRFQFWQPCSIARPGQVSDGQPFVHPRELGRDVAVYGPHKRRWWAIVTEEAGADYGPVEARSLGVAMWIAERLGDDKMELLAMRPEGNA